jgi:hypothetical protein
VCTPPSSPQLSDHLHWALHGHRLFGCPSLQPPQSQSSDFWNVFSLAGNQLSGDVPAYLTAANTRVNVFLEGNSFR